MSTFVGHALVASLVTTTAGRNLDSRERKFLIILGALIAQIPDLDIIIYVALKPLGMVPHRGFSHSLIFALLFSGAAGRICSRWIKIGFQRLWTVLFIVGVSHLFLDYLMGAGPPVPFFFPYQVDGYLFPIRLLPIAYYGKSAAAYLSSSFWLLNGIAAVLEILIFIPLIAATRKELTRQTRLLGLILTVISIIITFKIYN